MSDNNVRIRINLFGSWASLPIFHVGDEARVLSVISVVVSTIVRGRIDRGWSGRRSTGAWPVLTAGATVVRRCSTVLEKREMLKVKEMSLSANNDSILLSLSCTLDTHPPLTAAHSIRA